MITSTQTPLPRSPSPRTPRVAPPVDIYESAEELLLQLDVPGATPETLQVQVEGRRLDVNLERGDGQADYGRAFTLPDALDPDAVRAELSAGVLVLHVGKRNTSRARRIPILPAGERVVEAN